MYDKNSFIIALLLFMALLLVNQIAFALGKRNHSVDNPEMKTQSTAIQTGIIGLLALLLGFTFNMSLQRYDARSNAVIEESGAINRVAMHVSLLGSPNKAEIFEELDQYLALRIKLSQVDQSDTKTRQAINKDVSASQLRLLAFAEKELDNPTKTSAANSFYQALTQLILVENKRTSMLRLHVPEPVLFLLFIVFLTAGGMLGYTSGLGNKRPAFPTVVMFTLIVFVVFIIIDLDRPKRGVIKVNQESLIDTSLQLQEYKLSI